MGVKKLFFDDSRADVVSDGNNTPPDDIACAADNIYTKYRNARIDEIFEHGERTAKFYGQRNMNDVLKMFKTIPFAALNVMVKDYMAGVHDIKALDAQRAAYKVDVDTLAQEQKFG